MDLDEARLPPIFYIAVKRLYTRSAVVDFFYLTCYDPNTLSAQNVNEALGTTWKAGSPNMYSETLPSPTTFKIAT